MLNNCFTLTSKPCCSRRCVQGPSDLQVAVAAAGAAPPLDQVTPRRTVEEVTVVVAAAVLVQDVPHLGLEEGHVHVDGHHLQGAQTVSGASSWSTS